MLRIMFMSFSCEFTLGWMPEYTFDDLSISVQVKAWHHQTTMIWAVKYVFWIPRANISSTELARRKF